ncbi:DUF6531 domain-containing protein [uncultured Friedmanniella sp.]|uniref:DUF6531 domain-containing protein n=1 Tax=uncultured Friedmanniella sp. TaxID=335381 RepID=UPI0035CAA49C
MGDLRGIAADVIFDDGVADALIATCQDAATAIEGQSGSRLSWQITAQVDFAGYFSRLFAANATVAAGDAVELGHRLREVATGAQRRKEGARLEQQRREVARAWKVQHDQRSGGNKVGDWLSGGDDPPFGPPAEEPTIAVSPPVNRSRATPPPGSGGGADGGGGTSSARPSDLRTFALGSQRANDELRRMPVGLRVAFASFGQSCRWGTLDALGVFTGFERWLAANDEDVRWVTTLASAFAAAGGDHRVSSVANSALSGALRASHVDVSRADLVIEGPSAMFGQDVTSGYADDPVNTATGNFVEHETDLSFPGAAGSLALTRCYNSFNAEVGAFGPGWSSLAESGLTFDPVAGLARFRLPDGREVTFPRLGDGWDRAVGENLWLVASGDGLAVGDNVGGWWRLTTGGSLSGFGSGAGDGRGAIRLVRDAAGRLARLEHGRGRYLDLGWGTVADSERVVSATASDGRRVDYRYDDWGRLTAVADPAGTRTYRWSGSDGQPSGLVSAVVDADGVVEAENVYDERGRVASQRSPFGRVTRYAYLPGRVTVVSDEDGSRSNSWIADARGRLVGVVDAAEHRQSTSYDRWGNPVLLTERDGATTVHEYDLRGRRVRTVTPSGADVTVGYDEHDRVTTVVTEKGAVTTYSYDGAERNPSTVADAEGGVTRLVWQDGLLTEVTDPVGVVVRFRYDVFGDLMTVTDAAGGVARTVRDAAGRVTAALTPSGQRTQYDYHPVTGVLASRRDPDGAVWRYEHTAAGRLTAVVDPLGGRTSVEHGVHGAESRTVDPLGRVITRQVDDLGLLAGVELPDGSAWRFTHDALSRLVASTDPTGAVWRSEYEPSGALTATVDPTGVRRSVGVDRASGRLRVDDGTACTVTGFDPLGRPTSLGQEDGSAAALSYDRCGRPVESLDAEGGLTLIRRDAAGRPVAVVSPTGSVTGYEYDQCGRLAAVVDPLGARTTIAYDADGRAVRQTLPTGEIAWTRYDGCGRPVVHHQPGAGTSTYGYDRCGRVVESRDPQQGRRRFSYDVAGQMVAVTDGGGGVTRFGYDVLGRAVEIINPTGAVTRREFDGLNRCTAETDPLGRTTSAGYDAAGRLAWQTDPDGHTTTWTYDAAGRPLGMAVDGRTVATLARDLRLRTVTVDDHTRADRVSRHVLEWNRRGQLVRRVRDGRAVSWTYDADGRRSTMSTPDGLTTRYGCDGAGRLISVAHPLFGRATFDRDRAGRLIAAAAGGLLQTWEHRDGHVVAHTVTDTGGATRTGIDRDPDGRILAVSRDGVETRYSYDGACQLTEARTSGSVTRWRYDAAGRLAAESVDDAMVEHVYDLAGQLLATTAADGRRTAFAYDSLGRRTHTSDGRGRVEEFGWSPTGHLGSITEHVDDRVKRTTLHTDALGELAVLEGGEDESEFFWDTAAYAGAPVLAGGLPVVAAGPLTGIGETWTAPGWRTSRSAGADPWSVGAGGRSGSGFEVGAAGEISVGGLEFMGARVYDPASRAFLSVDPLDPVIGAGWAGNPYSYAGNDPLHALDPTGLNPVSDADLAAYRNRNGLGGNLLGANVAVNQWMHDNGEYVAGGAMVVAGGALIATGVGGPIGMMLVSAGADTIIQKATTGDVNWTEVAVAGAAGGVGFGAGSAVTGAALRTGASIGMRESIAAGVAGGAADGGIFRGGSYLAGPGPHTVSELTDRTVRGAFVGGVTGGAGGAAAHGISTYAGRTLSAVRPSLTSQGGSGKPFTSSDPHVADAANAIERALPGRVRSVNSNVAMKNLHSREVDIDLGDLGVQVKSGNARGLTGQMQKTRATTDLTVIGYAPDMPRGAWFNAASQGLPIARDTDELIAIVRELG